MKIKIINILTDGDGAFTGTLVVKEPAKLFAVRWVDGDMVDGVDAVLKVTEFAPWSVETTLLTLSNANNDALYYPRPVADDAAGADVADSYTMPLVHGVVSLAVTSGGAAKTGQCLLYLDE